MLVAIARVPAQIGDQERADANRFARAGVGAHLVRHPSKVYAPRLVRLWVNGLPTAFAIFHGLSMVAALGPR